MNSSIVKTAEVPFFHCNPELANLLAVRADIPSLAALENASSFLAAACALAYQAAGHHDLEEVFAIAYLIEFAKGIVDAAVSGLQTDGDTA